MSDLIITSVDTNLSPKVTQSFITASDHFPIFTELQITPTPLPPPSLHSFRRINSINITDFTNDLASTNLIKQPPQCLSQLLLDYDSTLRSILDKHAPIITKLCKSRKSNPWFTPALLAFKTIRRHLERIYIASHSPSDYKILRTPSNRYNKLIALAKKEYHSKIVQ